MSVPHRLYAYRGVQPWGAGQVPSLPQQVQEGKDTVEKQQPLTLWETRVLRPSPLLVAISQEEHSPRHGGVRNPGCSQVERRDTDLAPPHVCNPRRAWRGGRSCT